MPVVTHRLGEHRPERVRGYECDYLSVPELSVLRRLRKDTNAGATVEERRFSAASAKENDSGFSPRARADYSLV